VIVASAPFRISLGGGGTDLPWWSDRFGGFVLSAAIDRRLHVIVGERFDGRVRVAVEGAAEEIVDAAADVGHARVREALAAASIDRGVDVLGASDVPPGSGLGGSGAFQVALLAALHAHRGTDAPPRRLAEEACTIEIERLGEPVGRQDPYVAAFGGAVAMTFSAGGGVDVAPLAAAPGALDELASRLLLVHTGVTRPAGAVLRAQVSSIEVDPAAMRAMQRIAALGHEVHRLLRAGDVDAYGDLLHEHWCRKRATSPAVTSPGLDALYDEARQAGAVGGKLLGAGGGGFFLLQARRGERDRLAATLDARGRRSLPVRFDARGACILADFRR
jgi:D-glycero-alpha-D-manno-heptose-7-phosphate kinase